MHVVLFRCTIPFIAFGAFQKGIKATFIVGTAMYTCIEEAANEDATSEDIVSRTFSDGHSLHTSSYPHAYNDIAHNAKKT